MNEYTHETNNKTNHIGFDVKMDTGLYEYQGDTHKEAIPGKSRILRLYMPQQPEPIIMIDVDELIIGRVSGENRLDLSLLYGSMLGVSREHAKINFVDGQYTITDLKSSNGTYLNNHILPVNTPRRLESADQLRFGHFVMVINIS